MQKQATARFLKSSHLVGALRREHRNWNRSHQGYGGVVGRPAFGLFWPYGSIASLLRALAAWVSTEQWVLQIAEAVGSEDA